MPRQRPHVLRPNASVGLSSSSVCVGGGWWGSAYELLRSHVPGEVLIFSCRSPDTCTLPLPCGDDSVVVSGSAHRNACVCHFSLAAAPPVIFEADHTQNGKTTYFNRKPCLPGRHISTSQICKALNDAWYDGGNNFRVQTLYIKRILTVNHIYQADNRYKLDMQINKLRVLR